MKVSINVVVFCICKFVAFGCGLDGDFYEKKHVIVKLIEANTIVRREVESIRGQYRELLEVKCPRIYGTGLNISVTI